MASYPYLSTLRSTTPPLYYHRPEGSAPSYYTIPTRDVEALRIPQHGDGAKSAPPPPTAQPAPVSGYPRASVSLHPSTDRSSTQRQQQQQQQPPPPPSPRLSGYAMPSVVNPYAAPTSYGGPEAVHTMAPSYAPPASTAATPRWSYQQPQQPQQYPTVDPLAARVTALDAEETAMAAEEMTLRAKLTELQLARKRQDEEQLYLSHGWAEMLEKEERYYTEPMVDRRPDIMAREQQCAMLHDRLQQAEAHAQHAQAQLQATDYILGEVERFEQERKRIQEGFQDIERRRRECVSKAERYFDVEAKRVVEGNRAIRKLDVQLREMTQRGPLAQLQGGQTHRSSSSRMVTFATDKSIVLDLGREESAEPSTGESGGGMTNSYANTFDSATASSSGMGYMGMNEEDIGGTSIAFSFNDTKDALLAKRRKTEIASV